MEQAPEEIKPSLFNIFTVDNNIGFIRQHDR